MSTPLRRRGESSPRADRENPSQPTPSRTALLLKDIENALRGKTKGNIDASEPLRLLCEAAKLLIDLSISSNTVQEDLKDIRQQLNRIEKNTTKTTAAVNSYASVAATGHFQRGGPSATTSVTAFEHQRQLEEVKKSKTVIIRIKNEAERAGIAALSARTLIDIVKRHESKKGDVLAARRLPSGDIELLTSTLEAKARVEADAALLKHVAPSAHAVPRTFAVMAHGIRIDSVDVVNPQASIKKLEAENKGLHPGLQVARISWTRRALSGSKSSSSLIIEVPSAEMANRLIKEGLLQDYSHRLCEFYDRACRIKQCFHCQKYGHLGMTCRNSLRCAACGQSHRSNECKTAADQRRCAVCDGKHPAWSHQCPARIEEKRRLNHLWNSRPSMHVEVGTTSSQHDLPSASARGRSSGRASPARRASASSSSSANRFAALASAGMEDSAIGSSQSPQSSQYGSTADSTLMSLDFIETENRFPTLPSSHGKRAHSQGPGESRPEGPRGRRASSPEAVQVLSSQLTSSSSPDSDAATTPENALVRLRDVPGSGPRSRLGRPPGSKTTNRSAFRSDR